MNPLTRRGRRGRRDRRGRRSRDVPHSPDETPPGETTPDPTTPGETSPGETASGGTRPAKTPTAEKFPIGGPSGETSPAKTSPGGTSPGGTSPGSRLSGGTSPDETSPAERFPVSGPSGGTPSGDTPSGDTADGSGPSDGTASGGTPSDGTPSEGTASGGTPSGSAASGGTPSGGTPSGGTPSGGTPSGGTPSGGTASGSAACDGTASGGAASDGTDSGGTASGGAASGGREQGVGVSGVRSVGQARLRAVPLAAAVGLLAATLLAGVLVGAAGLPVGGVLKALADRIPFVHIDSGLGVIDENVLFELRLPRALMAALVGGMLAMAGAGYQGVFRNPLADPYLLGAAAGAGVGATTVIVLLPGDPGYAVPLAAFVGAIGGVFLAYALGSTAGRGNGAATLVLAGVAVSSFLAAVQTFLQQLKAEELQRIFSWLLGGVGSADWHQLALIAPYSLVSTVVLLAHGRLLDVLSVGDEEAASLGLSAARVRLTVLVAASLATACAVAVSGLIGFVGIVVPHVVRRLAGGSYRTVLPLSLLGGAAFLEAADLVARTVIEPGELPLGVVTAFVGGPFFVAVLRASRRQVET